MKQTFFHWLTFLFVITGFCTTKAQRNITLPYQECIADAEVRQLVTTGFQHLYHFRFSSADSVCTQLRVYHGSSPWGYLLSANYWWWKIISGDKGQQEHEMFLAYLSIAEKKAADMPGNEGTFCRILTFAFRARMEILEGRYYSTAKQLSKYYREVNATFGKETQYPGFYLTSGLYNYFMAEAMSNYTVLRPILIFFASGSKDKGILYLKNLTHHPNPMLSSEANYFLMKIYTEVEHKPETALLYAQKLYNMYPENYIYAHYIYSIKKTLKSAQSVSMQASLYEAGLKNSQLTVNQRKYALTLSAEQ